MTQEFRILDDGSFVCILISDRNFVNEDAESIILCVPIDKPDFVGHVKTLLIPYIISVAANCSNIILAGCKADLRNTSSPGELQTFVDEDIASELIGTYTGENGRLAVIRDYVECSAITGTGVSRVFDQAVDLAYDTAIKRWRG